MKVVIASITIAAVSLAAFPQTAQAQGKSKTVAGVVMIAAGAGLMAGAFNYDTHCPPGYSTHTIDVGTVHETTCVSITSFGSDVRDASTSAYYARPAMLWTGIGSAVVGTVLLFLPKKVRQGTTKITAGLSVTPIPKGWMATKNIQF